MSTTNGVSSVNGHAPRPSSSNDLFAQFQATTRILLEAQQAQNRILERYLETQERVLLYCTDGTVPTASEVSLSPLPVADREVAPAPPPEPIPVVVPPRVQTAAAPRLGRPPVTIPAIASATPPRVAAAPARPAAPAPVSVPKLAAPATPLATSANDGPPSTEEFRQELLAVVSARTGYPADALDETLHLEAALGIDSIKTVEIFSNLKAFHKYFHADGQEEEELLAEFTKLKTLRDIINSYDRRRQAHLPQSDAVKRYEVTPIAAPLHLNGSKKNYLTAKSSSSSARYAS